jgi:polar amino acid transport system ATP-binding protein/sulfate transport system ATP-binding protein
MNRDYTLGAMLLKAEGIGLVLGGTRILRDINLEIRDIIRPAPLKQGQVVALLGPSGMGKTKLFEILSGLRQPTEGKVIINEHGDKAPEGLVGVVAQNYPLIEYMTVRDNLIFAARQRGADVREARARADAMLQRFSLSNRRDMYPRKLSGGQSQLVAIGQQLLCSEHFLLMDEPLSGLDVIQLENVCRLISEVASADDLNTIIIVTHDVTSACTIADTVWLLGRQRGADGKRIDGATVVKKYDLIAEGLAWEPNLQLSPKLLTFAAQVKAEFKDLE